MKFCEKKMAKTIKGREIPGKKVPYFDSFTWAGPGTISVYYGVFSPTLPVKRAPQTLKPALMREDLEAGFAGLHLAAGTRP